MQRSDLFATYPFGTPIDNEPPSGFFVVSSVPDVGELMLASFNLSNQYNCENWWISEKYDGLRACWNFSREKLYSQLIYYLHGRVLVLPDSFTTNETIMPDDLYIDGEIWFGRGSFVEVQKLMPKVPVDVPWERMRFIVFDIPLGFDPSIPFESRYSVLLQLSPENPFIQLCAQQKCQYDQHLKDFTQLILDTSGEGSIARKPTSTYEHGRSSSLLKLKASRMDMEARVVHLDDENIRLETPDGSMIDTKRSSFMDSNQQGDTLQLNDVVTFSCPSRFKSDSVSPVLSSIRHDLVWEDVVADYISGIPRKQHANAYTERALSKIESTQRPSGYWTREEGTNVKAFFDSLAHSRNMDPLIPETWYSVTISTIVAEGGISALKHSSGLANLLISTYPEIGLDPSKFQYSPRSYWQAADNRKKFFDSYAAKKGFDPLHAINWYTVGSTDIMTEKGGNSILAFYGKSLAKALAIVYPNIGLQQANFSHAPHKYYHDIANQKSFFDSFATKKRFDPLQSHNWYSVSTVDIKSEKGGPAIIRVYGESLIRALLSVYPNIGLDKLKFKTAPRGHWVLLENQKYFFLEFAQRNEFEPLVANNWYLHKDKAKKEGVSILKHHGGSIYKALSAVFPSIGLQEIGFINEKQKKLTKSPIRL